MLMSTVHENSGAHMNTQKFGTLSTNERYWALMGAFEHPLVLMTAHEHSGAGFRGTNIIHKHAGAFMNIE